MNLIIPWLIAIAIGFPIAYCLIRMGRKHDWFEDKYLISHKELTNQLDSFFEGRAHLSAEDFYLQYFEAQGIPKEIPIQVRDIFEEMFEADFSRISSTDDFSEELQFIWGFDSMIDVELAMTLEAQFGIKIEDEEAVEMKSIQDIVVAVWKKLD